VFLELQAAFAKGPPKWQRPVSATVRFLVALALALVVMEQWCVLLLLGSIAGGLWGIAVATVVVAAQILAMFEQSSGRSSRRDGQRRRVWFPR
jgi:hypothetical protein